MSDIADGITVFIIFLGLSTPILIVFLVYYLKKRLEHKQILAAIEKGADLSQLRPPEKTGPSWIKNLTAGIAMLIIGIGLASMLHIQTFREPFPARGRIGYLIALILFGIGISRFICGLLQRKTEQRLQSSNQNNNTRDGKQPPVLPAEPAKQ